MTRPANVSPCSLASVLIAGVVGLSVAATAVREAREQHREHDRAAAPTEEAGEGEVQADVLRGLWMRYDRRGEGDPLRFWYFHGDGKGLYRYGKVGLAHTHSFDYAVDGDLLDLRFRKSGERHHSRVRLERDGAGDQWLVILDDPREAGARYRFVPSDLGEALTDAPEPELAGAGELGDRIWIDYRNYATGGAGFAMYQLAAPAIDGRGVGWFHRGDFDDWSTESLTYRVDGERLELFFDLREEPAVTPFALVPGEDGARTLVLDADPRDYWARHVYKDGGRSFGTEAFGAVEAVRAFEASLQAD